MENRPEKIIADILASTPSEDRGHLLGKIAEELNNKDLRYTGLLFEEASKSYNKTKNS